jgi:hypothetical protein
MSTSRSRKAKRFQRFQEALRQGIRHARNAANKAVRRRLVKPAYAALEKLLRDIERSDICVWAVARAIQCTEEEEAMIAKIVAPHLGRMTQAHVLSRLPLTD